jgi:opacity protein-like surface antigen
MKSISLPALAVAGACGLALGGVAAAQPPLAAPPTVDWTGVYAGLNIGGDVFDNPFRGSGVTVQQLTTADVGPGFASDPPAFFKTIGGRGEDSDWLWGGQLGFNQQMGSFVWGIEGDANELFGQARNSALYALAPTALTDASAVGIVRTADPRWQVTVGPRVGWSTGSLLLYATGGAAFAKVREGAAYSYAPSVTAAVASANPGVAFGPYGSGWEADKTLTGWTVGAGAEVALSKSVSLGAEYRHADYGDRDYSLAGPGRVAEFSRVGFNDDSVVAKVNLRFANHLF